MIVKLNKQTLITTSGVGTTVFDAVGGIVQLGNGQHKLIH